MTTPTQAAIEAARERLAKVAEVGAYPSTTEEYRAGFYDYTCETQALAFALQEMSDAVKEAKSNYDGLAFPRLAPFILPDPVDPLLIEAREIAAQDPIWMADGTPAEIRQGHRDDFSQVRVALAALRRGMELAKVQP